MRISDWSSDVCSSDLVGSFHQLGEWHVGHAPLLEDLIRDWVEGQERASEPLKDIGHDRANAASSHDPDRSVAEIEPKQAIQREVPLPDPDIRPVQLAGESQYGRAACRERVCQYV